MFSLSKYKNRIIAGLTAVALIISLAVSLNIFSPLWAASSTSATDPTSGFSMEFGFGSNCSGDNQSFTFAQNSRSKQVTTRIKYSASDYTDSYPAGDLSIILASPFPIYRIGADLSSKSSKSYQFSYKLLSAGSGSNYYTYELTNNYDLDGSVFDGYIDVVWNINWNRLVDFCGLPASPTYGQVMSAMPPQRPFDIYATMSSKTNKISGLSLSARMFFSVEKNSMTHKYFNQNSSVTGAVADIPSPEYVFVQYNYSFSSENGIMKPYSEELIFEIPEYAELTSDSNYTPVESNHPVLNLHNGYKAYYAKDLSPRITVMYPMKYNNSNQIIYAHVYSYYTEDRPFYYWYSDKEASSYVKAKETGSGSADSSSEVISNDGTVVPFNVRTPQVQYTTGNVPPSETNYKTANTYESALTNGLFMNERFITGHMADAGSMGYLFDTDSDSNVGYLLNSPDYYPIVDFSNIRSLSQDLAELASEDISYIPLETESSNTVKIHNISDSSMYSGYYEYKNGGLSETSFDSNDNCAILFEGLSESQAANYWTALSASHANNRAGLLFQLAQLPPLLNEEDATDADYYLYKSGSDYLIYYPIDNYYITKSNDNSYNIVCSTIAPSETADDPYSTDAPYKKVQYKKTGFTNADGEREFTASNPRDTWVPSVYDKEYEDDLCEITNFKFVPSYIILDKSDDLSTDVAASDLQQIIKTRSLEEWYSKNHLVIPGAVLFANGITQEVYLDFIDANKDNQFQSTSLSNDEYEYSYVSAPSYKNKYVIFNYGASPNTDGSYAAYSSGYKAAFNDSNDLGEPEQSWALYIKKRGDSDYSEYADYANGYAANEKILLPEGTVSAKFVFHSTYDELYKSSLSGQKRFHRSRSNGGGSHKIISFDYGVYIYPDAISNFNAENRSFISSKAYTSSKTYITAIDSVLFTPTSTFTDTLNNWSTTAADYGYIDNDEEQKLNARETSEYGQRLYTVSDTETLYTKHNASAGSSISMKLTGNDVVSQGTISGNTVIDATDLIDEELVINDKYFPDLTKISKIEQYVVFPKNIPITPDLDNITFRNDGLLVSNTSREAIPNISEYIKSHTTVEYDDISYDDVNVIKLKSTFEDDSLVVSALVDAGHSGVSFDIPIKFDKSAYISKDTIDLYSEIEGSTLNGRSDIDQYNLSGKSTAASPYMLWHASAATPDIDETALAGHRTVSLKIASDATYGNYSIDAGKAGVGDEYTYKFSVSAASNQLGKMVLYNKMEAASLGSEWKGILKSVGASLNGSEYTDFQVYYSTSANTGLLSEDSTWTLLDDSISNEQKAAIQSLAIKPNQDLFISERDSFYITISMTAPVSADHVELKTFNESTLYAVSYNDGSPNGAAQPITTNLTTTELVLDKTSVCVRLRDSDNMSPLPGGQFKIYDAETDEPVSNDVFVSGTDGMTGILAISRGKYYAAQISAPDGYNITAIKYPFTIGVSLLSKDLNIVDAYNQRGRVSVNIIKTDAVTSSPIKGAAFQFVDAVNSDISFPTGLTSDDGKTSISIPWGEYTIKEMTVPVGYAAITPQNVIIDKDKINQEVSLPLADDRQLGTLTLYVIGEDDYKIPDAEYDLFVGENKIGHFTTDTEGTIKIENALEWGDYRIVPTNDPEGYDRNPDGLTFSISSDNLSVILKDRLTRKLGKIVLVKQDEDNTNTLLEGAKYTLYDVNGSPVIENIITDENGEAVVENLPWGSYYFQEDSAPFGYSLSDKKTIINISRGTVSATQRIAVTDSSTSGSIKIIKKVPEKDINYDIETPNFIFKVTGTTDGGNKYQFYTVVSLPSSCKTVDGMKTAYSVISDLPQGQWTIQEQPVIRYSPSNIISSVDTDVDVGNVVTTTADSITFGLTAATLNAVAEFKNEKLYKEGFSSTDMVVNTLSGPGNMVGITAVTKAPSYAPATLITIDDIKLSFIDEAGESTPIDLTDAKYHISEVSCEYDEPGTYIYPITLTVNTQSYSSQKANVAVAVVTDNEDNAGPLYTPRKAGYAPVVSAGQITYETVVKIVISEFSYEVLEDGTATITECKGKKESVEIPSVIDGYTVTQIGSPEAYNGSASGNVNIHLKGNEHIKKLILPSTLKNISQGAIYSFYNSATDFINLEEVVISSGTHLENIYPYSLNFGTSRSGGYTSRPCVITVEDNVVIDNIYSYAFGSNGSSVGNNSGYPSDVKIVWGNSSYAKNIFSYALYGLKLDDFVFPEGTENIGSFVFAGRVPSITLPYSLKYAASYLATCDTCITKGINAYYNSHCFAGVSTSVVMPFAIPNALGANDNGYQISYDSSILDGIDWEYSAPQKFLYSTKLTNEMLNSSDSTYNALIAPSLSEDISLPSNVNYIDASSYSSNSIIIDPDDQLIEAYTLSNLKFTGDNIPNTLESISVSELTDDIGVGISADSNLKYAEAENKGLSGSNFAIPQNMKVGYHALIPSNSRTSIYYNASDMKLIAPVLWSNANNGTDDNSYLVNYNNVDEVDIVVGSSVKSIPANALKYDFVHDNTRTGTNSYVKMNMLKSSSISIPSNVETIEESAFENISFKNISLSEGLKYLDKKAFYSDYSVKTTLIGDYAYTYHMDYNLNGVNVLNEMILPDSLEFIGERVFGPSDTITTIHFGPNVKFIHPEFIDIEDYPSLSTIEVDTNNPYYVCEDGMTIYDRNKTRVIFSIDPAVRLGAVNQDSEEMVIINDKLIAVNNPSDNITVPEGVTAIAPGAFYGIEAESVSLPQSLTTIETRAFYNTKIGNIVIPKNVSRIDDKAFTNELAPATISSYMGGSATYSSDIPNAYFENLTCTLSFESDSKLTYIGKKAFAAVDFSGDIAIPSSVETIDDLAFAGCKKVGTVTFGENSHLKKINFGAFISCGISKNYSSYDYPTITELPASLEYIDDFVFYYCQLYGYDFRTLTKLKYIGDFAFSERSCRNETDDSGKLLNNKIYSQDLKHIIIPESVESVGLKAFSVGSNRAGSVQQTAASFISSVYLMSDNVKVKTQSTFGAMTYSTKGYYIMGDLALNAKHTYNEGFVKIYGNSAQIKSLCDELGYAYYNYTSTDDSGFEYKELPDGTLEITGVTPEIHIIDRGVTVPRTINGKLVSSIADNAFTSMFVQNCIRTVTVENGITRIGNDLFFDYEAQKEFYSRFHSSMPCTYYPTITSLQLPDSVTSLGTATRGCKYIVNFQTPSGVNDDKTT